MRALSHSWQTKTECVYNAMQMNFKKAKRKKKSDSFLRKKCAELHYNVYAYI